MLNRISIILPERILIQPVHVYFIRKLIKIQETQLENMERNFHDTVMQSYNLAKEIYDHVNRVADDSSIQLEGKNRKVKMIEILLRELEPEEKGFEVPETINTNKYIMKP